MTAEQQLERSVLEGKERDELHAIAQALSVKTNTRTKKADMIDGILKATGVSVDTGTPEDATTTGNGGGRSNGSTGAGRRTPRSTRGAASAQADAEEPSTGTATEVDGSGGGGSAPRPQARRGARHTFGPEDDAVASNARVDLDEELDIPASTNGSSPDSGGSGQDQTDGAQGSQSGGNPQGLS